MNIPKTLEGKQVGNATFSFPNLVPALYMMEVSYKSFLVEQDLTIPSGETTVVFPAEFPVSFRVLDSHGISMNGVVIRLVRGGKSVDIDYNTSGSTVSIPPGFYHVSVISGDKVISQRSIDVISERSIDLITTQEPIYTLGVLFLGIVSILCGFGWSVRRKDPTYTLIFLAVGVGVVSLVCPWWSLQGSSSSVQTSSSLYLFPLDLVSLTSTAEVTAGELAFFPDIFVSIMTIVVSIIIIEWCWLVGVVVVERFIKKRWFILTLVGVIGLALGTLVLFSVVMSAFTEVGVGSFFGNGLVDVSIQGQEQVIPVMCQWGPGLGFWLDIASIIILLCTLVLIVLKIRKKKKGLF